MRNSIKLFKGNEDAWSQRGWFINIFIESELHSVGFISYGCLDTRPYNLLEQKKCSLLPQLTSKVCLEIEWYLEKEYQRKGIGSAAFKAVSDYVSNNETVNGFKINYLVALIPPSNKESQDFAKSHNFKNLGVDPKAKKEIWALLLEGAK